MSQKFDWRSEDDVKWESDDGRGELRLSPKITRRRWLLIGILGLLILSIGLLAFRQIERYLDETGMDLDEEILSSNDLLYIAAQEADPEILVSLLSGRDPAWADGQLALLQSGLMFDRSPFGFEWQPEQQPSNEVTISPGLDSADVVTHLEYSFASGRGRSEIMTLDHYFHYRRSNNRWLLAPPQRDYWGSAELIEGYYLNIGFPGRDSTIGRRLASDLEGALAAFCNLDDASFCATGFPMQVRLVADPVSISQFNLPVSRLDGASNLDLPTPSLFGVPSDEVAYQAMYRSYAERLVTAITAAQIGWQCCDNLVIYQALMDLLLSRLGLIPWPLTTNHYRQALDEPLDFGEHLWREQHPDDDNLQNKDAMLAHLLVEYIDNDWRAVPITELQRMLLSANSYEEWLETAIQPANVSAFWEGWQPFLSDRLDSLE